MRLELDRITCAYGDVIALEDVSLEMNTPEVLTIVGPNGSGKSTLLKAIARIVRLRRGQIRLDGVGHDEWPGREYAQRVGYLGQQNDLPFSMRAIDVVLSGRAPYLSRFRWESEADHEAARVALELCDASHLAQRELDAMSGGEKKRIFLARVLAADPELILLDEPLASLDVAHVEALATVMRQQVQRGKYVVFVSHDFNWAAAVSDRVAVMARGRLAALGTPAEVLTPAVMHEVFGIRAEILHGSSGVGWIVPAFARQ